MKRFARQFTRQLNPAEDVTELGRLLDLPGPVKCMECFDISNISTTHLVASMVCFQGGKPVPRLYRRYRIQGVIGQDDFASMAEVVRRRYQRVLREKLRQPDLIIVDGGKGQLSAALTELKHLGLSHLPLIGLAKEREEIFRPEHSEPLVLDPNSGALRLLQRIRDEAHRWANGYHQLLMKRRISESLLDDCPGISENRKTLLLRHFRSVTRLKHATVEDLAAVKGISRKLAEDVAVYLQRSTT